MAKVFTFEQIMGAKDMQRTAVPVPEWDAEAVLMIRPLAPGENVRAYKAATQAGIVDTDVYNRTVFAMSVVEPMLTDEQVATIWANRSALAVDRIIQQINEINGFAPKIQEALKADFRPGRGEAVEVPADEPLSDSDGSGT